MVSLICQALSGELVNVLREAGQVVPASLMKFGTHVKKKVILSYFLFCWFLYFIASVMIYSSTNLFYLIYFFSFFGFYLNGNFSHP